MNFREQQEIIYNFIINNYNDYLPGHLKDPTYTTAFLDFDKFKSDFTVFVDFARINFPDSDYRDDCEDVENLALTIYLVHRNNTSEVLQANNLDSAHAFYKMVREKYSFGIANATIINSIDFYNWVEGNKYLVVTEINLSLDIGL
jgi:hypothetical protein